jgi:hypothetical protein
LVGVNYNQVRNPILIAAPETLFESDPDDGPSESALHQPHVADDFESPNLKHFKPGVGCPVHQSRFTCNLGLINWNPAW